jgi:hypothetical protein
MGWMSPTSSHQVHKESDCVYQAAQDVPHDSEIEKRGIFQLRGFLFKSYKAGRTSTYQIRIPLFSNYL